MAENNSIFVNKEFDARIFKTIFKRNWYFLAGTILFFLSVAFIYLRYSKPIYNSELILQIDNEDRGKEIIEIENLNTTKVGVNKEVELLRSQFLFEKAINSLNMSVSLFAEGKVITEEKYVQSTFNVTLLGLKDSTIAGIPINIAAKNGDLFINYFFSGKTYNFPIILEKTIRTKQFDIIIKSSNKASLLQELNKNKLYFVINTLGDLTKKMLLNLNVTLMDPSAKTVSVSYKSYNPSLSRDVVAAVAKSFLEYDEKLKREGAEKILAFIDLQLDSLNREVENSKNEIGNYQRTSNLPDPDSYGANLSGKISKYQEDIHVLNLELRSISTIAGKLRDDPNRVDVYRLIPELMGKSFESALNGSLTSLYDLLEKKEDLLFRVTNESSEVKNIDQRIQSKLLNVRKSVSAIEDRIKTNLFSIRGNLNALESQYFSIPEKKQELGRLENLQDLNEKYFNLLTEKKVTYSISNAGFSTNSRILSQPEVSFDPMTPKRKLIYGLFLFLGVFVGLLILFYKYVTFNEINTTEDLKKLLPEKITILGGIPLLSEQLEFSKLIVETKSRSEIAEAMRNIRMNMSFVNKEARTIAVSSSISGEGKTFVALNLAGIIAMTGKKTVIIDLDMRKPKIHVGFEASNVNGMSTLLTKQSTLEECIQESKLENLSFITAGIIPPNPSELILSEEFKHVLEQLKSRFDIIVIDNPPIGIVSDGVHVLAEADIPIYVFKAHYSKRIFTRRVVDLFEVQGVSKMNVILNGIPINKSNSYGYGYGYGYGYYENDNEKSSIFAKIKAFFKK